VMPMVEAVPLRLPLKLGSSGFTSTGVVYGVPAWF
jgi:hypothetical protein